MPASASSDYPSPLRHYLGSLLRETSSNGAEIASGRKFTGSKRSKTKKGHPQPGQLSLPLTMTSPSEPQRKRDQMGTFEDILSRPADDIKPPALIPVGTYHTILIGLPERGKSSKKQTDFFKFTHKIVAPTSDVDEEALAAFDGNIIGTEIDNTIYVTEKSAFMLKEFLENTGLSLEGRSMGSAIDETPNREVMIYIKHEASEDGQRMFARVGKTMPVGS